MNGAFVAEGFDMRVGGPDNCPIWYLVVEICCVVAISTSRVDFPSAFCVFEEA